MYIDTVALVTVREWLEDESRFMTCRVAFYGKTFEEIGKLIDSYFGNAVEDCTIEFIEGPLYLDKETYLKFKNDDIGIYSED